MTIQELEAMQSDPLEIKVNRSLTKILEFCVRTNYKIAVSFSGGKDSAVLLDLVARVWKMQKEEHNNSPLHVVFANTGNEFAGMGRFVKDYIRYAEDKHDIKIDLHMERGEKVFHEVIRDIGYPVVSKKVARQVRTIRAWMKKSGADWDVVNKLLINMPPDKELKCMPPEMISNLNSVKELRKMGCPDGTILYLAGVSKDGRFIPSWKLSVKWRPLIIAPFEASEQCCDIIKKAPLKAIENKYGVYPIVGEMASDSKGREEAYLKTGCNAFSGKKRMSKPLGPWMEQDVLAYTHLQELPHFRVYGDLDNLPCGEWCFTGEQRTGCKLCMFGIGFKRRRSMFVDLHKLEPNTVRYAFRPISDKGLGYGEVVEYLNTQCNAKIETVEI